MFKIALTVFCLVLAAQAKIRTSRLPEQLWRIPKFRNLHDEKIVGGTEVVPHSIPFQVSLQLAFIDFHFCGGSVASKDFIVTASHCCDGQSPGDIKVVAGKHDLSKVESTEQVVEVAKIHMHPRYSPGTISNDICLLELKTPLELNTYVKAVPVPYAFQSFSGSGVVSGWGTLSGGGTSPDKLHSVRVPLVSDEDCRDAYGASSIDDSMLCAGEAGRDSCQGDSGGPLTCGGTHCGVVSWGYGCAVAGYPGVYAETSHFMDFLTDYLK